MMYQYEVLLESGKTVTGFIEADSPEDANTQLETFLSGKQVHLPNVDGFFGGWLKTDKDQIRDWRIKTD